MANRWETETISDLVSVGTHKLFVSTSGPSRRANSPVVVFCTGGGLPSATYCRLQTLLSSTHRVYFYDRTGYDRSERGPEPRLNAQAAAIELRALLDGIGVHPPYVFVGHSYGCIIARAFVELVGPGLVCGLVLAEAATELAYQLFPESIPNKALQVVFGRLDFDELTNLRKESQLSEQEWQRSQDAISRSEAGSNAEEYYAGGRTLAAAKQFERHAMDPFPVSVIRCSLTKDFRTMYEEGVSRGQGMLEQRKEALAFIETFDLFEDELKASQLRLSNCNHYASYPNLRHDFLLRQPELVAAEVDWVFERQT